MVVLLAQIELTLIMDSEVVPVQEAGGAEVNRVQLVSKLIEFDRRPLVWGERRVWLPMIA